MAYEGVILIISDHFDQHADLVVSKLSHKGLPFYRLNLDTDSLKNTEISFCEGRWEIISKSGFLYSEDVNCVWLRRPFIELSLEEQNNSDIGFQIWRGEWNKTLLGFYNSIRNKPWLNSLSKAYKAENKYLQMELARELELSMPDTLVSNQKNRLIAFSVQRFPLP
jgi:hypothetical protein